MGRPRTKFAPLRHAPPPLAMLTPEEGRALGELLRSHWHGVTLTVTKRNGRSTRLLRRLAKLGYIEVERKNEYTMKPVTVAMAAHAGWIAPL
jgi:hypothetical protein